MGQRWLDGYSADVEIFISIGGQRYDVAQIGRGTLILREPAPIPPLTDATLTIKIDGREEISQIFLTDGAEKDQQPVAFHTLAALS